MSPDDHRAGPDASSGRDRYRDQIGRARHAVTTPALLLDLDIVRRNSSAMAARFRELPAALRPHIKVHKSVEMARMEVAAGAVGVACATVWEAEVMARGGIADVLVANQVVHPDKVAALAELARDHRVTVAVDDSRNVAALDAAAVAAGSTLEVLIEVDVGMGRCGVRSSGETLPLADAIASAKRLTLRGLQGYEGHCTLEPDEQVRARKTRAANDKLIHAGELLATHGHHCDVLSGGGTGTYYLTGANPGISEVQAGSYLLMDLFHAGLVPGGFEFALTVLGSVVSEQGSTVVLDTGRKSIGIDFVTPQLAGPSEGAVRYVAEEHCLIDFPGPAPLHLGDTAELLPGYGPTTVNLHDVFHVVEGGVIIDIWPVDPRGPGRNRSIGRDQR